MEPYYTILDSCIYRDRSQEMNSSTSLLLHQHAHFVFDIILLLLRLWSMFTAQWIAV